MTQLTAWSWLGSAAHGAPERPAPAGPMSLQAVGSASDTLLCATIIQHVWYMKQPQAGEETQLAAAEPPSWPLLRPVEETPGQNRAYPGRPSTQGRDALSVRERNSGSLPVLTIGS